uniref:Tubulin-specific chaperone A n=1 Tax=Poecilia reticulata TaxID=8081 RepID=A0A3P9Q1Z0_POERE
GVHSSSTVMAEPRIRQIKIKTGIVKRYFMEVLQESRMMVPDCRRRLSVAHADLLQLLESEADLVESEEYKEARKVLDSVKLEG